MQYYLYMRNSLTHWKLRIISQLSIRIELFKLCFKIFCILAVSSFQVHLLHIFLIYMNLGRFVIQCKSIKVPVWALQLKNHRGNYLNWLKFMLDVIKIRWITHESNGVNPYKDMFFSQRMWRARWITAIQAKCSLNGKHSFIVLSMNLTILQCTGDKGSNYFLFLLKLPNPSELSII